MTNSYPDPPVAPAPTWPKHTITKARNQVKSKFYYVFWGVATTSVVLGQLYVGAGYRAYAGALMRIFDSVEVEFNRGYIPPRRFY